MSRSLSSMAFCGAAAFIALACAVCPSAKAQIIISKTGTCPGPMTLNISSAAPNSVVTVLKANNLGSHVVGFGPCAGTALRLGSAGLTIVISNVPTNNLGNASVSGNVPAAWCGQWCQVIQAGAVPCFTSQPLQIL